jgi:hypothetical protein
MDAKTQKFQGPGQWRTQAEESRPDTVFADLADIARRLQDKGLGDAQQAVHRAEAALQGEDQETGASELRAAARLCQTAAPAYAAGLRDIAGRLSAGAPAQAGPLKSAPDKADTTEHLDVHPD